MAVNLEGGCRVTDMRESEPVINGTLHIWNQIGRATGAQAISLRVMEFLPGLSPGIRNGDCDEILFVLSHGAEGAKSNSQGQARGPQRGSPAGVEVRSAPPLDQGSSKSPHPEAVREDDQGIKLIIDGSAFEVSGDTGIYIRPQQLSQSTIPLWNRFL